MKLKEFFTLVENALVEGKIFADSNVHVLLTNDSNVSDDYYAHIKAIETADKDLNILLHL